MTPAPPMTVWEYFATPESVRPQELAYGVLRVADAPTPWHQSIVFALGIAMDRQARVPGLGRVYLAPVDVILDRERHLVVQPDLVFVAQERLDIVRDRIWGAPDLVVEVLSPKPRIGDLDERVTWFREHGVRECWLVRQVERTVEVIEFDARMVHARRTYLSWVAIQSGVLPGWRLSIDNVLADYPEVSHFKAGGEPWPTA